MLEQFSGNWLCLKDGEIEKCSKDDGERRTGLHFTQDGGGTAALEKQSTIFSSSALSFDYPSCPPLHFSSCLEAAICEPSCSILVSTPGSLSHRGQCACICVCACPYLQLRAYVCLCMATQKHDCVFVNFSIFIHVAELETIFHLQNTRQHHRMSHPFHLLPQLSVTPASTPCLMDFQMQVHDFFQDLTGIFLCV